MHWQDIFAGYELNFLLKKGSVFYSEIAFSDSLIILTPKKGIHLLLLFFFVEKHILVLIFIGSLMKFWGGLVHMYFRNYFGVCLLEQVL